MATEINEITQHHEQLCKNQIDIGEHLPVLVDICKQYDVKTILDLGKDYNEVNYTFAHYLLTYQPDEGELISWYSGGEGTIRNFKDLVDRTNLYLEIHMGNHLEWHNDHDFDLVFIRTLNIYPRLKLELAKYASQTKMIIMHNTVIDAHFGEVVRAYRHEWYGCDPPEVVAKRLNYPVKEVMTGMIPAIEEFLGAHPEFYIERHLLNNNGLMVLRKKET